MAEAHPGALILFGPPGSGKGTQARLLKESLTIPHISTGDMLRERMQAGDDLGKVIRHLLDAGELVTDDLVNLMVEERIGRADCEAGFILDGYPRTLGQAGTITRRMAARGFGWTVVHLKVDYNKIIGRLASRRQCSQCATVFNLLSSPPKHEGLCDKCGSRLVIRDDDKESVIRRRLEAYDVQTRPLLEFFSGEGSPFFEVDGADDPPAVIAGRIRHLVRPSVVVEPRA